MTTLPKSAPISAPPSASLSPRTGPEANGFAPEIDRMPNGRPGIVPGQAHQLFLTDEDPQAAKYPSAPAGRPVESQPGSWSFAAIGDYGSGSAAQVEVAASLLKRKPEMVVTLGDNAYNYGFERDWKTKWDPQERFGAIRASVPVYPSLGNHDEIWSTKPYFKRFPELNRARYYSFQHKDVQFVALDSNQSLAPSSKQHKWMADQLAKSDAKFKVVYMHHPLVSSANRSQKTKFNEYLGPVLAKTGVDLVLTGHEHWYERSKPLNEAGTVHVTHGGGGRGVSRFDLEQQPWSAHRLSALGHLSIEVTNDALIGRNILRDGSVDDTFVIPARAR